MDYRWREGDGFGRKSQEVGPVTDCDYSVADFLPTKKTHTHVYTHTHTHTHTHKHNLSCVGLN